MDFLKYEAPSGITEAIALLSENPGKAKVFAGGTDVLVQMHMDRMEAGVLVDLKRIVELKQIHVSDDGIRFGAAMSCASLMKHGELGARWAGVVDGIKLIGSHQVKGRASVGGNLCNASPAADSIPGMIAVGAKASIIGPGGRRELPVEDVVVSPGKTVLREGEFIESFFLPRPAPSTASAYQRFTPRTEMDIAVVGVGISLSLDDDGFCSDAKVALGAVAERPIVAAQAGDALIGSRLDTAAMDDMRHAVMAACRPIDDKRGTREFRIKVAGVLARRVADIALQRARTIR